ncbi:MAG: ABC transporter substrate-binding protein [Anaerolineae bacterium]|nr:ABC transporter substrate-binding protein [Anaerolineae bacterium]
MLTSASMRRRLPVSLGVLGVLIAILCLAGVVVALLALRAGLDDKDGGNRIVYGLTLNPSGFDPHIHISNELGIPFYSVYDTLIYRHPQTMDFVPGLAERWEMAPDGLSWTFALRRDVTFHDGTSFNAQAVAANLDRITNPELASGKALALLGPYTGYTVVDDFTIMLHLSEPYAPLLDGLSQVYLGMASPAALREYSKNTYQWHQVGTGPYRLEEIVPGDRIILRRNPEYAWGPVFYAEATDQSVDTVEFRFYTDPATRSLALESDAVQMIGELLPTDVELLLGNTQLRVLRVPIPGLPQQFFFNTKRAPTDELAVRQALLYATNRTEIVDAVFQGQSPVAHGPLTATTPFYDPAVEALYPFDPTFAQSLLLGAGYGDSDNDGIWDRGGEPLRLTMIFPSWNQTPEVAQLIQSEWRDIGIEVELIRVPDFPTLRSYALEGDFNLIAFYDFGVEASLLNQFYMTGGANNWSGFSDSELDGWLHEAARQVDAGTRAALYSSVQQRIMEQAVVLPIREYVNLNGTTARLDGVIFSAQGWWPLLRNLQLRP